MTRCAGMGFGACDRRDSLLLGETELTDGDGRLDSGGLGLAGDDDDDGLSRTSSGSGKSSRSSSLLRRCVRSYTKSLSTGFTRLRMGRFEVEVLALSSVEVWLGLGFRMKSGTSGGIMHMELREALIGLLRFLDSGLGTLVVALSSNVPLAVRTGLLVSSCGGSVVLPTGDSTKDMSVRMVSQLRLTASMIEFICSLALGVFSDVVFLAFSTTWTLINEEMSSTSP